MDTRESKSLSSPTLATLLLEALQHMASFLTPRDRVSLMLTSRGMYDRVMPFLYLQDALMDRHALRWACHYGELAVLDRSLAFSPPGRADAYFPDGRSPRVSWNQFNDWKGVDRDLGQPPGGDFYDTPLITAVRRSQAAAVRMLLRHGADPGKADRTAFRWHGSLWAPLHWAMLAAVTHSGAPWSIPSWHVAVRRRTMPNADVVRALLEAGADPNKPSLAREPPSEDENGPRPVDRAARRPLELAADTCVSVEVFEMLLSAGADPTLPSPLVGSPPTPQTPLDRVLETGIKTTGLAKAELLLNHDLGHDPGRDWPNRNLTCTPGVPLLCDVLNRWVKRRAGMKTPQLDLALRFLGAVLESGKKKGLSSYIDTAVTEQMPIRDGRYNDPFGENALRLAASLQGIVEEITLDPNPVEATLPITIHVVEKRTQLAVPVIRFLLGAGADPGAVDAAGMTAVHAAAHWDNTYGLMALFENHGARALVNQPDAQGWTPLHWATQVAHPDPDDDLGLQAYTAEVLLEAGADVSARDRDGRTALDLALAGQRAATDPITQSARRDLASAIQDHFLPRFLSLEVPESSVSKHTFEPVEKWFEDPPEDRWPMGGDW